MKHLSLEQCQRLRELGFPQNSLFGWYQSKVEKTAYYVNLPWNPTWEDGEFVCACPTLEELIEWLGDDFYTLTNQGKGFTAHSGRDNLRGSSRGVTPLEAVYNLAVAIKERN